jgi:hypothetical protein
MAKKKKASDQEDENQVIIKHPETNEKYSFSPDILEGGDWSGMSQNADNLFTTEEIKNYHQFALKGPSSAYKDQTDLGPEIKDFWIQEIWDKINPGVKVLSHYLETGPLDLNNEWVGSQYTIVVCLTPDMKPEDGGALELWTPNLTDKMKAMACNTLYTFNADEENNPDLLYSFWPRPGRQIVFDSRIPYLIRTPENGKTSLRLVFKGTNKDYIPETTGDEIVFTEVE